jgi:hypothetical protein
MSHRVLNQEQFHYHISPTENRESIKKFGLIGSSRHSQGGYPRVYLTDQPAHYAGFASEEEPMDVWKVRTTGLKLHPDPLPGDRAKGAVYHESDIGPRRVSHHGDAEEYAWEHGERED